MASTTDKGRGAEGRAVAHLAALGYEILDRNARTAGGELDIVAREGAVLVFVEVRARSGCKFGTPFESVTWQKRQRLCRMAESYLCAKRLAGIACRFDVVSILEEHGTQSIELVKGAFDMASR